MALCLALMLSLLPMFGAAADIPDNLKDPSNHSVTSINENWLDNSWQPVGPGGGGAMYNPQCSPLDPNLVMITCDMSGTFVSHNKGATWMMVNLGGMYNAVSYDLNDEDVIYAGSSALYKSTDKGLNWTRIFPHEDRSIEKNKGYHANPIYYTPDFADYPTQDGTMDAGYDDYALDIGYPACPPPDGYPYQGTVTAISVDPEDSDNVYVTISKATGQNSGVAIKDYLFFSDNGGETFDLVVEDLTTRPGTAGYPFYWVTTAVSSPIKIIPDGGEVFIVFNDRISKVNIATGEVARITTTPNITSFKSADYIIENGIVTYYICASKNIYKSADLINFTAISRPNNNSANVADFSPCSNEVFFVRSGNDFYRTTDGGATWALIFDTSYRTNPEKYTPSWFETPGNGNVGGPGSGIGYGWSNKNGVPPYNGFGASKADGLQCYQTTDGLCYSTIDGGVTWRNNISLDTAGVIDLGSGETPTYTTNGCGVTTTYGIHYDPFDPNHIISSTTDVGMHMSYDGGKSWVLWTVNTNHGIPNEWRNTCYWAEFDPDLQDVVYSVWSWVHDFPNMRYMPERTAYGKTGFGGFCISTDGGKHWTPVNYAPVGSGDGSYSGTAASPHHITESGLPTNIVPTHITVGPMTDTGRTLYISTMGSGIFKSVDGGYHWRQMNNGIEPIEHKYAQNKTLDGINTVTGQPGLTYSFNGVTYPRWPWDPDYSYFTWTTVWADNGTGDGVLYTTNTRSGSEFVGQAPGQIYVSYDGAENWQKLTMPGDEDHRVDYVSDFAVDPNDSNTIYVACWQSTNGQPNYLMCDPEDAKPNSGGVYKSTDGGQTWKLCWGEDRYVFGVNLDPYNANNVFAVTFQGELVVSTDAGETWTQIKGFDFKWSYSPFIDINHPDFLFVTTFGGGIWRGPTGIEPALKEITVNGAAIDGFDPDVLDYTVFASGASIDIGAEAIYHTAKISGDVGAQTLSDGSVYTIVVENEIGTLSRTYTVTVSMVPSLTLIKEATALVGSYNLGYGIANSLTVKLNNAAKSLKKGNRAAAIDQVSSFVSEVRDLNGTKLNAEQANSLTAAGAKIIDTIRAEMGL
jgi:photosystem II stability/assembly factor-like uncharacterized protein